VNQQAANQLGYSEHRAAPADHSPTLGELAASLAKAQGAMKAAQKRAVALVRYKNKDGSMGPERRREYADFASVVEAVREPLATNGLSYVQLPTAGDGCIGVRTMLMHASGEWIRSTLMLPVHPSADAQQIGSAVSYARRYSLMAITGIATDDEDDDDGGAAAGTPTNRQQNGAVPPPPPTPVGRPVSAGKATLEGAEAARAFAHNLREAGVAGDGDAVQQLWVDACAREKQFGATNMKKLEVVYNEAMTAVVAFQRSERRTLDGGAA
jgi:hypothetical protein